MKNTKQYGIAIAGILYATNETNQCNEEFADDEANEDVQDVGLIPEVAFTQN